MAGKHEHLSGAAARLQRLDRGLVVLVPRAHGGDQAAAVGGERDGHVSVR
jgi:hypothetical protein